MAAGGAVACACSLSRERWKSPCGLSFGNAAGLILLMGCVQRETGKRLVLVRAEPEKRGRGNVGGGGGGTQAPKKTTVKRSKTTEETELENVEGMEAAESPSPARSLFRTSGVMSTEERDLRFLFLESLMENSRSGNIEGVEEVMSEMDVVGFKPGPHSYHGLVAAYARANDVHGALHALRREMTSGEKPLQETFVSVGKLLGRAGQPARGKQLIGAVEKANLDARSAWIAICEELFKAGYLMEANELFMVGANCGLRASDHLYDILVEENCKTSKHGVAIDILKSMEARGRLGTTFHYNCLLLAQGNANFPEIAEETFETMEHLRPDTKPDTESFNLMIQAQTRCDNGERVLEVIELIGHMAEEHPRVKPNARTYALVVECFVKFNYMNEALRHFRALTRHFPGSLHILHCNGNYGEPLSLMLRSLCLEGRIVQLIEVFELMKLEGLKITPRAMFMNRKGRTLVSSWIEPLQEEADIGCEVDFVARYIAEGGLTGTRRRWTPAARKDKTKVLPDYDGYRFSPPVERSYRRFCTMKRREYKCKLVKLLEFEGMYALGENASEEEYNEILERLRRETARKRFGDRRKPKAASKLSVGELKEELEAQGLPSDGNRSILYQRVQKARRINLEKGQPLWMPPEEEQSEEVDEVFEAQLAKIDLRNPRQQFRKKCFIEGVGLDKLYKENPHMIDDPIIEEMEGAPKESDTDLDDVKDDDEPPVDGGEVEVDERPPVAKTSEDEEEEEEVEELDPAVVQEAKTPENLDGRYVPLTLEEKRAELVASRFDFREMEEIEEIWGWSWERDLQAQPPEMWSRKREVELSVKVIEHVVDLGGEPTLGDCAMLVRNAMKIPWPEMIVKLIRQAHKCDHKFGSSLYEDAVANCLLAEERDAAVAILTDMEEAGVSTPNELLGRVLPPDN